MEIDSGCVDWESDVPQCELLFAAESDQDCGATVDVSLVDVYLFQGAEEDDIGGRTVVDQYSFDQAVGDEQRDD